MTRGAFMNKLTSLEDFEDYAYKLATAYDRFAQECLERNFTLEFNLFTLWLSCQRPPMIERQKI
jgi:hypothetical protein